ncbi:hypothetical protein J2W97_000475 [Paenibacillus jamilae]|jgi:hypothetical protein|uniref:hypothetical protein n=1 Tax=Paenibacillus TaxID=44249 RepID=UPI00142E805E|nr:MULTISPECIES: hypothetical protein [Paenibacillus]MDP9674492.1 hypothetical protein [Paenibacillus jamilae]KAF6617235.1 hypothetical protein HFE00_13230 [Paenibacillus sp. EKM101P]KAF6622037.1 hypothetical protein HFE03_13045 [Paenibacillus sp. EKM102P]KAF6631412.1 hypothetical protein HFE01_13910 [Paenibacillus sp. EKM10P]KAF6650061.1 hypothetical protein HFE02_05065 [Paenibacillus sp. EKM11P]
MKLMDYVEKGYCVRSGHRFANDLILRSLLPLNLFYPMRKGVNSGVKANADASSDSNSSLRYNMHTVTIALLKSTPYFIAGRKGKSKKLSAAYARRLG